MEYAIAIQETRQIRRFNRCLRIDHLALRREVYYLLDWPSINCDGAGVSIYFLQVVRPHDQDLVLAQSMRYEVAHREGNSDLELDPFALLNNLLF